VKYINIEVRPEDAVGAIPYNSQYCPVARALKRTYPLVSLDDIHVGTRQLVLKERKYLHSHKLSEVIATYDETGEFHYATYRAFLIDE